MANRYSAQFVQSMHKSLFTVDTQIAIGGTGAVSSFTNANVIKGVTRLAAGQYQVQLVDNFSNFYQMSGSAWAPVTGSALTVTIADSALTVGTLYQIVTLGTTTAANWLSLGVPAGVTAAVGVVFKALVVGVGTGTGTVKAIGYSGISFIEVVGTPTLTVGPIGYGNGGSIIVFQTLQPQQTGTTTNNTPVKLVATDPTSGSTISLFIFMGNSSVTS